MSHKYLFDPDLAVLAIIIAEYETSFEDARVVYQNPMSLQKFGNLNGRSFKSIFLEVASKEGTEKYQQLKHKESISLAGRLKNVDVKLHSRVNGKTIQTSISDNTEIFKLRDEVQRAKIIDSFLMIGSHELKTPLNAIMGMSSLMLEGIPEGEAKEMLELIFSSSNKLGDIINKMLNYVYLNETPESYHKMVDVSIAESLKKAQAVLNKYLHDRILILDKAELRDTKIIGLPDGTIEDIILELAINLRRNTPPGKRIFVKSFDLENAVKLEIENQGFGIPPDKLNEVFKPFFLLQNKMNHSSGFDYGKAGMGIGLTIIKKCIDQLGGKIWFENKYQYVEGKENSVILNIEFPIIRSL